MLRGMCVVRRVVVATAFAVGLGWALPAFAEGDAVSGDPAPARSSERWYGWQTLATDGFAAAMATTALAMNNGNSDAFWALGIGSYTLGAPIIHFVHDRPWVGAGDFALRLGVPFVGMFLGSKFDDHMTCDWNMDCRLSDTGMIAGGLIGAAAISILDASAFTYEAPRPAKTHYAEAARPRIWPNLALTPKGGRIGVSAAF